jgi:hypothetical protein
MLKPLRASPDELARQSSERYMLRTRVVEKKLHTCFANIEAFGILILVKKELLSCKSHLKHFPSGLSRLVRLGCFII